MRLGTSFFEQDVLVVAPLLIGKQLVRLYDDGHVEKYIISETEAYDGENDLACHACRGRTERNKVMYGHGGLIYVYLVYGMYWMINFVTGQKDHPQAVLLRGVEGINGPGKLTRQLQIDKSFYAEDLATSKRIWVEDDRTTSKFRTDKRVGIDYAGDFWKNVPWRFIKI